MLGQTLNHRYKIISQLGEGGMGEVFLAVDEQTRQQVAIKILARQLTAQPETLKRFRREGETLRQLDHPNIVKFIDAFEHDKQYVIVMEYVAGGSLFDLLKKGPLSIERAHRITLELCDALIRSHHLNIIHRDIKPENVLLTENGNPKLADFGVARLSEGGRMTRTGTQVGTPYYMAPEAWDGKPLDAQADIWSLGIMLFEMLAGHVPFIGDTPIAVMSKVHNSPLPDLKKLRPDVPANIIKINKRMLTRDKKRRYQIMREVGVDLEKSLQTPVRPLQSVTSNVAKSITGIQSKVSSLAKARSKPVSKTRITDENKAKSKSPIKFSFKPTLAFGLIPIVLILLTSSIFLAPQIQSLLSSRTTASPIQSDSTLTNNPLVTTTQTITLTTTPDPRINAKVAEVCGENICISNGFSEILDTIPNPSSFVINSAPPSWSPDGTQLVLAEREGKGEEFPNSIYILNIQTKQFAELTVSARTSSSPSWSPNGEYIAYTEACHVMIISPDGSNKRELFHNSFDGNCANLKRWSPNSKFIAWLAYHNTKQKFVGFGIIDVESKSSAFMDYEFAPDQQIEMAWSPDGSRLNLYYPEVADGSFFSVRASCSETECGIDDLQIENGAYPEISWLPNYYPQWDGESETDITSSFTLTPSPTEDASNTDCINDVAFVADVTIFDGTVMKPGEIFTKTWRLKNTGTCTWTSKYSLVFESGDRMNGQKTNLISNLTPGEEVDISLTLIAPSTADSYFGYWILVDENGDSFGDLFYVNIQVTP